MARVNGCPMSVRDWAIDVLAPGSTKTNPTWVRIKGVNSLTLSTEGDTEDGSSADTLWSEPYISKRSGSLSIEARPIINTVTGEQDAGQAYLDYYASLGGCDADCTLRLIDPYGRANIVDVTITSSERSADDTEESRSWDTEIIGEPEEVDYVQATAVKVKVGSGTASAAATASVAVGATQACTVEFTPTTASNQKYSVASSDPNRVRVKNIDGLNFNIVGVKATETGETATVTIRSMNNSLSATIAVTVTSGT